MISSASDADSGQRLEWVKQNILSLNIDTAVTLTGPRVMILATGVRLSRTFNSGVEQLWTIVSSAPTTLMEFSKLLNSGPGIYIWYMIMTI